MPGLGKTTLASKVYSDLLVLFHFHIHAWCYVSHGYSKRSLLVKILCCFDGGNSIQYRHEMHVDRIVKHPNLTKWSSG
ncbi:unnamed protein product [Coffea canephora]|uniref:NB-ARC domain-containing protein n=1 Tax=Coffea canephora TaxID=49390 RepID=A0A068UJE7_COFCA|nr:unnamed protein product [Coffea canephora]